MKNQWVTTVAVGAVFGLILGVAAAGVWAINTRQPDSYSFYGGSYEPLTPEGSDRPVQVFGSYSPDPSEPRLPVSSWVAIPAATTVVGLVMAAGACVGGVRLTRVQR